MVITDLSQVIAALYVKEEILVTFITVFLKGYRRKYWKSLFLGYHFHKL